MRASPIVRPAFAGAIDAQIAPENAEADVQYSDDTEFAVLYPDPEIKLTMEMADIPLLIQEMILNNIIDDNGALIRAAGDAPATSRLGSRARRLTEPTASCGCSRAAPRP